MNRNEQFETFLAECKIKKQWCGLGNPLANILIVGQEPYGDEPKTDREYSDYLEDNYANCRFNHCFCDRDNNDTWDHYQELIEYIYKEEFSKPYHDKTKYDFIEFAYTTELSSWPRRKSYYPQAKQHIQKRFPLLKESDYINGFPVIILACGGYIHNNGGGENRQIDNVFKVEYDGDEKGKNYYTSMNWFYTHHGDGGRKLVIHTRQLSQNVKQELIPDMSIVIRDHLRKCGLL